ncbi:MAG: UvrD-helicase domain-containing protein [bacterium]|nr:UvrD-helicase domain-containing protein [bacterium]
MHILLAPLNDRQRKAVQQTNGPLLILAGAGSGKTKTLIHRIAYIIATEDVKPWNILAVTFTNKAAGEIKDRLQKLLKGKVKKLPVVGTFHSICVQILRREIEILGYDTNYVIYDASDSDSLIKKCMKDLGYDTKVIAPKIIKYMISSAKNDLKDVSAYEAEASETIEKTAAHVYSKYQGELQRNNALDFDDLIQLTVKLFQEHPEVLKKYQAAFKYILVDEYQDTNHAQYTLVHQLADKHHNICVVGDDFQSIYSWRGANLQNILDFEDDYPDAVVVLLEQNYRSTKRILEAANEVIKYNTSQKEKVLWTDNDRGHKIVVKEVENEQLEGEFIIREIFDFSDNNEPKDNDDISYTPIQIAEADESILDKIMKSQTFKDYKVDLALEEVIKRQKRDINLAEYVILYRTNAQSRALEETFMKYNIPYRLIGGIKFYERKEIKDFIAYMKVVANPADWVSLERIYNIPARSLGRNSWLKIEQACRDNEATFVELSETKLPPLREKQRLAFLNFQKTMQEIIAAAPEKTPSDLLTMIADKTGYTDQFSPKLSEDQRRIENIEELKSVTKKFDHLPGQAGINSFLEEVALISDQDDVDESTNAVTMMTVHAAKGLEFNNVFVAGMEEGLFPHARSLFQPLEMEEERRLCYVALTRARERAYLIYANQRTVFGTTKIVSASRFIADIPEKLVEKM